MATNIPPHNLREVIAAAIALADDPDITTVGLMKHIQGPDFPTGGQILNNKVELRQIYETGQGAIRLRGEYKLEEKKRGGTDIVITSIPYALTKATWSRRSRRSSSRASCRYLLDVRDESTTDVRIVLEIKREADPALVMAYLYKHTPLQVNFNINMTCLVPPDYLAGGRAKARCRGRRRVCQPLRLGIKEVLRYFLDFRYEVTCRRFEHELAQLKKRIHVLEGFVTIFDALDETIKIIRASDGKDDAAKKIMKRFGLDDLQVDAILELKLYKLAKLEIRVIREELADKQAQAKKIELILKSETKLWAVIKDELKQVADELGTPRRSKTGGAADEQEFDADAFIVDEDAHVIVTRDGWIKRVREIKDPSQDPRPRGRRGHGRAARLDQGEGHLPDQPGLGLRPQDQRHRRHHRLRRPGAEVLQVRRRRAHRRRLHARPARAHPADLPGGVAPRLRPALRLGRAQRGHDPRRPPLRQAAGPGDEVIGVAPCADRDVVVAATAGGHVLLCKAEEIAKLEGAGRGVTVIKTADDDLVIGFVSGGKDALVVETATAPSDSRAVADPKQVGRAVARATRS